LRNFAAWSGGQPGVVGKALIIRNSRIVTTMQRTPLLAVV